ncbi:MAG: hypothetical protein MZW92_03265 [Comamonadaceae bacterium]|nr:hypothetical protein [Comamonadaceae bacterium]
MAFLADVKAGTKATYLVFYNNPEAAKPVYPTDLVVTRGRGLGRTIENGVLPDHPPRDERRHHTRSSRSRPASKLEHKLETNGAIHWNPDVYAPPHAWYHSSDWTDPERDGGRGRAGLLFAQPQGKAASAGGRRRRHPLSVLRRIAGRHGRVGDDGRPRTSSSWPCATPRSYSTRRSSPRRRSSGTGRRRSWTSRPRRATRTTPPCCGRTRLGSASSTRPRASGSPRSISRCRRPTSTAARPRSSSRSSTSSTGRGITCRGASSIRSPRTTRPGCCRSRPAASTTTGAPGSLSPIRKRRASGRISTAGSTRWKHPLAVMRGHRDLPGEPRGLGRAHPDRAFEEGVKGATGGNARRK